LGIRGERKVTQFLTDSLAEYGYRVIPDLVNEKGNIDHIIVGPAGVFVVETKTYSKAGGDERVSYDGETIRVNRNVPERNPIKQVLGEKYWLEGFIRDEIGISLEVQPVIIYPKWYIDPSCKKAKIWICNTSEKWLPARLKEAEKVLSPEEVSNIYKKICDYVRNYNHEE
jgi:hypothetical protein